jgi:hypothetical protein
MASLPDPVAVNRFPLEMGDAPFKFLSRSSSSFSKMTRVLRGRLRLLPNEGSALVPVLLMSENCFFDRLTSQRSLTLVLDKMW